MHSEFSRSHVPVCAIGASAGGVGANTELFHLLPSNLRLAYVVVVHLAPDHPSALAEIIAGHTNMPVKQVKDRARLEPDHVYLIPPDRELVIDGDDVLARPFTKARGDRAPIDMFFRSVAEARGDGMAVILSGTGSDGATGVRAIKEAGGVVFVQEPKTAEFPMMPRSAIAMGVADFVEPIPGLAERIAEVAMSKEAVRSLPTEPADHALKRIVDFLHARTGHDFSSYKRATVQRRVARRMQVTRKSNLTDYLDYLTENPEEAQELFADLLISVTSFFRDPEAYEALAEQVIMPIFDDLKDREEREIRAWVAGCATGEEAYSLAILFLEEAARRGVQVPIQIFATDLDRGALATAREGRYPETIQADVSQERLDTFFVREGAHYRVRQEVRDTVLFAEHSILKDPPFLRLDLVTCRNLLIYLEKQMQHQVSALFAYGLRPHGYLFLGSAETTDAAGDLFVPVDREARLYRARPQASRKMPVVSRMPEFHQPAPMQASRHASHAEQEETVQRIHREALETVAPPSILVDRDYRVLNLSETAGRFLLPSAGPLSTEITALVRPELRLDLRTSVRRAVDSGARTMTTPIPVAFNGSRHRVGLFVAPARAGDGERGEALVLFLDSGPIDEANEPQAPDATSSDEVRRLRDELNAAETRLAESQSEQENAIQDLRVANEELQSMNEEYRSTAEELETSREELQSMNEELQTVNAELKNKLETIGAAHSDLHNLIAATDVGTLFLDSRLRIRMFTPRVADIFNITEVDVGRPITDFAHQLVYETLADDARKVLRDLSSLEHEVPTHEGRWLMVRLGPYRTVEDRIEGVVVTFVDITERREANQRLKESEERQKFLLSLTDALRDRQNPRAAMGAAAELLGRQFDVAYIGYAEVDSTDQVTTRAEYSARDRVARFAGQTYSLNGFGVKTADLLRSGKTLREEDIETAEGFTEEERAAVLALGVRSYIATPVIWKDRLEAYLFAAHDAPRKWTEQEMVLLRETAERTFTAVQRAIVEEALRKSQEEYRRLFESMDEGYLLAEVIHDEDGKAVDMHYLEANPAAVRLVKADFAGRRLSEIGEGFEEHWWTVPERALETGEAQRVELWAEPLGQWFDLGVTKIDDTRVAILFRDVTERKRHERERDLLVRELNHRVKNMLAVVSSIASQTMRTSPDMKSFVTAFDERIHSLSRAHNILTQCNWEGADLRNLVERTVEHFTAGDDTRVEIEGESVFLRPNTALSLSLALHELSTNALKHGAWSVEEGKVRIAWQEGKAGEVVLDWEEIGGPEVRRPRRSGFGSKLLKRGISRELGGRVSVDYAKHGLKCRIEFNRGGNVETAELDATGSRG